MEDNLEKIEEDLWRKARKPRALMLIASDPNFVFENDPSFNTITL